MAWRNGHSAAYTPPMRLATLLVVVLAAFGAACSTRNAAVVEVARLTPTPGATATTTSKPLVAGCRVELPPEVTPGRPAVRTVQSNGGPRQYRILLPAGFHRAEPAPVVLNFHGLGSNANEQEVYSGLVPIANREGFILVSPEGLGSPRNWSAFANLPLGANDVLFVNDLLDQLEREFCIDKDRVYATGMSNGAFMSSRLACDMSARLAAVAPVAGVYFPSVACSETMPVIAFHGTNDGTVPFETGRIFGVIPYAGARAGASAWSRHNGCAEPASVAVSAKVTRESFGGCRNGADVVLLVVEGGGHTWPGAAIEIGSPGATTQDISAAEEIWKFFEAHSRP